MKVLMSRIRRDRVLMRMMPAASRRLGSRVVRAQSSRPSLSPTDRRWHGVHHRSPGCRLDRRAARWCVCLPFRDNRSMSSGAAVGVSNPPENGPSTRASPMRWPGRLGSSTPPPGLTKMSARLRSPAPLNLPFVNPPRRSGRSSCCRNYPLVSTPSRETSGGSGCRGSAGSLA